MDLFFVFVAFVFFGLVTAHRARHEWSLSWQAGCSGPCYLIQWPRIVSSSEWDHRHAFKKNRKLIKNSGFTFAFISVQWHCSLFFRPNGWLLQPVMFKVDKILKFKNRIILFLVLASHFVVSLKRKVQHILWSPIYSSIRHWWGNC